MGYLENSLSKYLAQLGADVHVITADLHPNYLINGYASTYKQFAGNVEERTPGHVKRLNGFTLHTLGHERVLGYVRMIGLRKKLTEIRPDVVQTTAAVGWLPLDGALFKLLVGYKLFTGKSTTASVFPLSTRQHRIWDRERIKVILQRTIPGYMISLLTTRCFPATVDCADVAARFLGVPRRLMDISPLGVDTDLFRPVSSDADRQARFELRKNLGFKDTEIVCIYSGRFTNDKNPAVLASAIEKLRSAGEPYRGLFVGDGVQSEAIRRHNGCTIHPFVPVTELARYFRASDIGVWPTQESMSMLDAAACGIPIVVNHTLRATERIDGNGLAYRREDSEDLARVLLSLRSEDRRGAMGRHGAEKMRTQFSWRAIAEKRLGDYQSAFIKQGMSK
jgi:glycosyltransferase involved in cell wall biosynthesis